MSRRPQVLINKLHTYTGHKDAVYTVEAGVSDNLFFSSGGDGHVIEWDLNNFENGRLIAKVPTSVYALCCDKDNGRLIVGQNYEGIHVINLNDKSEIGSLKLSNAAIFDIKIHEDLILVAAGNGEFYIIDYKTLTVLKKSHISEVNLRTIAFTNTGSCLVGASDGQIIEVDLKSFEVLNQTLVHEKSVFCIIPYTGGFISSSRDARISFLTADISLDESINAHMYAINDIALHPSKAYFATGSMDKTIKIWDTNKRQLLKVIDKSRHAGHLTSVNKLYWSNFNNLLISCSDDRSISVWNLEIGN